jgi:hypothetical protein
MHHAMKMYLGSGGTAPATLPLGTDSLVSDVVGYQCFWVPCFLHLKSCWWHIPTKNQIISVAFRSGWYGGSQEALKAITITSCQTHYSFGFSFVKLYKCIWFQFQHSISKQFLRSIFCDMQYCLTQQNQVSDWDVRYEVFMVMKVKSRSAGLWHHVVIW